MTTISRFRKRAPKGATLSLVVSSVVSVLLFAASAWADDAPIGWASVNALGQNGTTGGAGGTVVTVTNPTDLKYYAGRTEPYVIQVSGTVNLSSTCYVKSNKTIVGVGANPTVTKGFNINEAYYNIIIRNLIITQGSPDGVGISEGAHHIWVDHCDLSNSGDGLLDVTHGADYVTVSWNHFYNHQKTSLVGHSDSNASEDTGHLTVTYHHNWWDQTIERHPRVRFSLLVHCFNNYYDGNATYGVVSACDAEVLVEGNYFKDVPHPTYCGYAASPPGDLVERLNYYDNSGTPETRGTVPEASTYYAYSLDPATSVPAIVMAGAGAGILGTQDDVTPPTPDPMTWDTPPYATGSSMIAMTATTATDPSGVQYYFANLTSPAHDSGWQDSPSYTDEVLDSLTQYTYTVKARDKSANQNETAASEALSATTTAPPVYGPPVAHWKLDESSGATAHDASGHGNDGTLENMSD
ncbi:hypothetical protein JW916_13090, partial [Candidatus Sumerlaeota bacterium]|nr:hypothetical protein [Candidatus Sumerlaeota bacterium]